MDEDGGSVEPGQDNSDRGQGVDLKRQKMRHVQDQARVVGDARMDNVDVADLDINVEDDEAFDFVDQDEIENREGFDIKELMKARSEEIGFMKELGVWEPSTWERMYREDRKNTREYTVGGRGQGPRGTSGDSKPTCCTRLQGEGRWPRVRSLRCDATP